MVLISDLCRHVGTVVEGVYRLRQSEWRTTRDGRAFFSGLIEDPSGRIAVYGWQPEFRAGVLEPEQLTSCQLRPRWRNDGLVADVLACHQQAVPSAHPLQLRAPERLPIPSLAGELRFFIEACPVPELKAFLEVLFANEGLAGAFLTLPASQSHHHAWPGGLAAHSLEVATIIRRTLIEADESERWLTCVAGLLHDLGKLRTLQSGGRRKVLGYLIDHEQLTLEILASALSVLDSEWPDGGAALRYLLTWRSGKPGGRPLLPGAVALEYADRLSSALAVRNDLFKDRPEWQRFARLEGRGPRTAFWRPRLP